MKDATELMKIAVIVKSNYNKFEMDMLNIEPVKFRRLNFIKQRQCIVILNRRP